MRREIPVRRGIIVLGLLGAVLLLGSCSGGGGGDGGGGTPDSTMFAVVNVDGSLRRGTTGTTSAQVAGGVTGDYTVTFPTSVAECSWVASVTASVEGNNPFTGQLGVTTFPGNANALYIQGSDSAGAGAALPFTVIVSCPNNSTMSAVVNVDGSLRRGTAGTTSAQVAGGVTGDYTVTFPGSVAGCSWVASVTASVEGNNPFTGQLGVTTFPGNANALYIQGSDSAGAGAALPFTVIVSCPNNSTMSAVVNVDGSLRRGTAGTTSAQVAGGVTGDYTVTFPGSVAGCSWVASVTASVEGNNPFTGQLGVTTFPGNANALYIQGSDSAGAGAALPFTVIVSCP